MPVLVAVCGHHRMREADPMQLDHTQWSLDVLLRFVRQVTETVAKEIVWDMMDQLHT